MVLSNKSMWINKIYQIILSPAHQEIMDFHCYKIYLECDSELHFKLCWLSSIVRIIIAILLDFTKSTMKGEKTKREKNPDYVSYFKHSIRAPKALCFPITRTYQSWNKWHNLAITSVLGWGWERRYSIGKKWNTSLPFLTEENSGNGLWIF